MALRITKKLSRDVANWAKVLRSGKYKQGRMYLQPSSKKYCCLGVLCDITIPYDRIKRSSGLMFGTDPNDQDHVPLWVRQVFIDFRVRTSICLTSLNDGRKLEVHSFDEIADLLEAVYVHKVL